MIPRAVDGDGRRSHTAVMEYRVLGPVEVIDGDRAVPLGGYRQRLVLALLLAQAGSVVTTDGLVDAVWGERPPRTARKTMQVYLTRLRALLGDDVVQSTPGGYRLAVAEGQVDAQRFTGLAERGHELLPVDPAAAADTLHQALDLWRGDPYGDLGGEPALLLDAQVLRERRLGTLADRVRADLDSGQATGLLGEITGLVGQHPRDERLLGSLLLAQYRDGRQAEALTAYEAYREALADELGAEPGPELRRLHAAILRHDPALGPAVPTPRIPGLATRNPYKGLRSFRPEDGSDFFGRDALVANLARRVTDARLVTVVGPSGSGKSSAVLAGLVPTLGARTGCSWRVLTMVPGRQPFEALLAAASDDTASLRLPGGDDDVVALADQLSNDDGQRLLLVVDQLEELFETVREDAVRERFVRALAAAVQDPDRPVTVLLCVRADALGLLLAAPPLGPLVSETIVGVVPLAPAELEAAAVGPARRVGVPVAPDLLAELVADMTDQPGALPQFEYALTEVFQQRDGPMLTLAAYRSLGGLRGVVSRRAEQGFQALDPAQREAARQVFLRLVNVADDGRTVRRRAPRPALEALGDAATVVAAVLDTFDRARLLTFDRHPGSGEATVEIAHEALLSEWPRLADWVAAAHDQLRLRRSLDSALADWEQSGQDEDYLLAGSRLAQVEAWQQTGSVRLTGPEQAYLLASRRRRDRARQAEADRFARELATQRQAAQRLRSLVAVVTAAALVATGLGLLAVQRGRDTAARERDARVRELATSSTLALSSDAELGVLLALEAVDQAASPEQTAVAVSALHAAVGADRVLARTSGAESVAFVDDDTLAVGGDDPRLVDTATGLTRLRLPPSPDGTPVVALGAARPQRLLAMGSDGGRLQLVSTETGRVVRELVDPRYHRAVGSSGDRLPLDVSPDGSLLVTAGGSVVVWDVVTGGIVVRMSDLFSEDQAVAFRPDGQAVAIGSDDTVQVRAIPSGAVLQRFDAIDAGMVTGLVYADAGRALVVATGTGALQVWDTASATRRAGGRSSGVLTSLALDDRTGMLLTGSDSGQVARWDLAADTPQGTTLLELPAAGSSVALAPSGDVAATVGADTVLTLQLAGTPHEGVAWPASLGVADTLGIPWFGQPLAVSADGARVATVQRGGSAVRVARLDGSDAIVLRSPPTPGAAVGSDVVTGIAFDPSRPELVTARMSVDGPQHSLETRDLTTGATTGRNETFVGGRAPHFSGGLAYSPTGAWLAASECLDNGPPALLVDARTLRLLRTSQPSTHTNCGHHVALDAAGRRLAAASDLQNGSNVFVFDTRSGAVVAELRHPSGATDVAFAPDGTRLLTVGQDGTGRVWDVDAGDVLHVLRGHRGTATAAQWSADASTVLTSGVDGTVRAWDAGTGAAGVVLTGLPGPAALALTPDGSRLVTVAGGEAQVWVWDTADLVSLARSRVDRMLTATECEQYGIIDCPPA